MSGSLNPPSFKRELVIWYVISFVILMSVSNLLLYYLLRSSVESDRNSILDDRFKAIAALLQQSDPDRGRSELTRRIIQEWPSRGVETTLFRIVDGKGGVILESPLFNGLQIQGEITSKSRRVERNGGRTFFIRAKILKNAAGLQNPVTILGAVDGEAGETFLRYHRDSAVAIVLLSALISLFLGWQITKRGLVSLSLMTETIEKIDLQTMGSRLKTANLPIELKPLADAFNKTLEGLEQSFTRLSRFSSDIAHELRTPVNNLLGELEVHLHKARTEVEDREILTSTLEECVRLHEIIEGLLFLARAENLKQDVQVVKLDSQAMLTSVLDFYEGSASDAGVSLLLDLPTNPIYLRAEKTLSQQAISNLLTNAIRYTPTGGTITVKLREDVTTAYIFVVDTGTGIATEHLIHVLDRFYRADPSRDHSSGGVGLGLAITKSIIDLHGGELELQSEAGKGTTVKLSWPKWASH